MHILMLTWDFPPTTTVGLTRQAAPLSAALVAAGHSVTVVTRHVAGAPSEESVMGSFGIVVIPIEGGKPVHAFSGPPFTAQGGVVQWTADGQGLLYSTAERLNIWLQPLSGGEPTRITNLAEQTIFKGSRSPDGKSLLLARGQQTRDVFLLTNFR